MTDASLIEQCQRLALEVEHTWLRLPWSTGLETAAPVPLPAALQLIQGSPETGPPQEQSFATAERAVRTALRDAKPPVAILLANVGAGKTVTMRWMARTFALRVVRHGLTDRTPFPIYLDLPSWQTHHADRDSFADLLDASRREQPSFSGPVIWLLDGADLLADPGPLGVREVFAAVRERAGAGECFVLAARLTDPVKAALAAWDSWSQIRLGGLSAAARRAWVGKHVPAAEAPLGEFEREHPQVAALLDSPHLFLMALSIYLDSGEFPRCDEYPGRTGVLKSFISYARDRAFEDGRIASRKSRAVEEEEAMVVESVFSAMFAAGRLDRIAHLDVEGYLEASYGGEAGDLAARMELWKAAAAELQAAGLLVELPDEGMLRPLYQEIGAYWAGRHLARTLAEAAERGQMDAVLREHSEDRWLLVMAHAIAIFSAGPGGLAGFRAAVAGLKAASIEQALALLIEMGGDSALDQVLAIAESGDLSERKAAVEALGKVNSERATSALVSLLRDQENGLGKTALQALAAFENLRLDRTRIPSTDSTAARVRKAVRQAFRRQRRESAIDLLLSPHSDPNYRQCWAGLRSLRRRGGEEAVETFVTLLADADPAVRRAAAQSLAQLKNEKAFERLLALRKDTDSPVREAAAEALEALKQHRAFEPLLAQLDDQNEELRTASVAALGRLGAERIVETLVASLMTSTHQARWMAARMMKGLSREEVVDLLAVLLNNDDPEVRSSAAQALADLQSERAFDTLLELLRDPDRRARAAAVQAISALKDERTFAPLLKLLRDPDEQVRKAAVRALGALESEKTVDTLLARLRSMAGPSGDRIPQILVEWLKDLYARYWLRPVWGPPGPLDAEGEAPSATPWLLFFLLAFIFGFGVAVVLLLIMIKSV